MPAGHRLLRQVDVRGVGVPEPEDALGTVRGAAVVAPTEALDEQHRPAPAGQRPRRCRARHAAADHHDLRHDPSLPGRPTPARNGRLDSDAWARALVTGCDSDPFGVRVCGRAALITIRVGRSPRRRDVVGTRARCVDGAHAVGRGRHSSREHVGVAAARHGCRHDLTVPVDLVRADRVVPRQIRQLRALRRYATTDIVITGEGGGGGGSIAVAVSESV